jgi:hypothetical protein
VSYDPTNRTIIFRAFAAGGLVGSAVTFAWGCFTCDAISWVGETVVRFFT